VFDTERRSGNVLHERYNNMAVWKTLM